nr:MAG: Beta-lactamase superfamily domain-containing protein [Candidatus Kentron sp. TUN]
MFRPARLTVIIHRSLQAHLERLFSYPFVKPAHELGFPVEIRAVEDGRIDFGGWALDTRSLQHNTPVIGARLQMKGGQSVTYCVDTTLCDGLLDLAGDCNILVIEASPPDNQKTNGFHLDLVQLRTVLAATGANKVILTHFGALKYPDMASRERLHPHIGDCHDNIVMAHDGLIVRL